MQSWTGKGSLSLFCALRPLTLLTQIAERPRTTPASPHTFKSVQHSLNWSAERRFTTTPILQRGKRTQKIKEAKARPDEARTEAKKAGKPPSTHPFLRDRRQGIAGTRDFDRLVESSLRDVHFRLNQTGQSLEGWDRFERQVLTACRAVDSKSGQRAGPLRQLKVSLQKAYLDSGVHGLRRELEFLRYADDLTAKYSTPNLQAQRKVADLRYPAEWYPHARSIQRTIHLHVGPTNSGKTYHALKRLEGCKVGFYAGPLRLLAQEVYHRFKDNGIACSLVTGDEVKSPEGGELPRVVSNTVEMVNLGQAYDVGVIDEIQMMADPSRGWAWTRAVLGSQASELHLCGEVRAVPLVRELCALTGDILEIHRYERLNPLEVMPHSLKGDLNNLQKGDCLVAFSRVGIHALKADIEKTTGRRAAIVYGGLPAEIRTQQARLFNDPDNDYDFLVASDAIGMGLNLSCKRIIFETLIKRLPTGLQRLSVPEIKQIGGRAGRYRPAGAEEDTTDGPNVGLVTSLEQVDLPYIQRAFDTEPAPLRAAGIIWPDFAFQKFAAYFPKDVPLEYLIKRLTEIGQVNPLFFMCDVRSSLANAEIIDSVPGLQIEDQLPLMVAPMDTRDPASREVTCSFADCVADNTRGRLLDIPTLNLEILQHPVSGSKDYMHALESLHRAIILYSWLSYRFGGVFTDRTLAAHVKELVEERMVRALTEFSANKKLRKDASLRRQIALQKQMLEEKRIDFDADGMSPNGEREETEADAAEESSLEGSNTSPEAESTEDNPSESSSSSLGADLEEENYMEESLLEESSLESSTPQPQSSEMR